MIEPQGGECCREWMQDIRELALWLVEQISAGQSVIAQKGARYVAVTHNGLAADVLDLGVGRHGGYKRCCLSPSAMSFCVEVDVSRAV